MKNICWIACLLLCFQQVSAQKKMHIGLKGAPCISWFQPKTTGLSGVGSRLGFSYGLITDFNFSENYAFGTGVDINHHGGELKYTGLINDVGGVSNELYKLQYLEIPITLKMRTKEIGYFTYYGQFGLGAGYLLSAQADTKFTDGNGAETKAKDVNVYKELKPLRASLIVGLGAEYNLSGTTKLIMGLAFDNGFTNPLKGNVYEIDDQGAYIKKDKKKIVTNYISINLGIIF